MGEWHQRPRCRELPKGRTTFGSGCLGYFCLAELYEGLRKSQDRRGAGHAPALSYESAWEADRACLGIYSRGSVWASGFARNEPCLQGVLEEANWRIVEFRLRATTPASSAMTPLTPPSAAPPADLLAVAQSKAVPPASGVSGFHMRLSPPTPAFNIPGEAFSLLRMSRPAMPAPVTPEGVFGPMPVGGAMIGGDASYFGYPYSGHDSGSYDPTYPSGDYDYCSYDPDIPQATMTPAPTTPDMHQATMTSAPTTPVSYPFQMEESRPPHQWNYPIYEGKGEDMRLEMSKGIGKGRLPAYEREYLLPKPPSIPPLPQLGGKFAYASSTAGGVCWSAHYPSYATTSRCREPSASTITRCYVGSIRFRGVGTWFLSGLRAEGCACSLDGGYSTKWIAYGSFRPFGSGRIVHGKGTPTCNPCSRCRLEGAFGHRTVCCSPDARNMVFGILESGLSVSQGA